MFLYQSLCGITSLPTVPVPALVGEKWQPVSLSPQQCSIQSVYPHRWHLLCHDTPELLRWPLRVAVLKAEAVSGGGDDRDETTQGKQDCPRLGAAFVPRIHLFCRGQNRAVLSRGACVVVHNDH